MANDHDGASKRTWSRRDLASRLLRPHLFFIRDASATPAAAETRELSAETDEFRGAGRPGVDIVCCGMYRACSTWQYEVVAHLAERYLGGKRLGYLTAAQYRTVTRPELPASLGKRRSVRVLKSHEGDRVFARSLAAGTARAVYAYRDVRDVVYSLAHKRKLTFEQLLRQGMIHQVLANDRFWSGRPHVLIQRYEDLLAAPADGVLALARHIGINLGRAEAEQIAEEYSQESNRARTAVLRHHLHQAGVDLHSADNAQICDATTLLHWNHMREPGASWRSEASPEHEAILNRLCGRWLFDHGYVEAGMRPGWLGVIGQKPRLSMRARINLAVGWLNYTIRGASLRFPVIAHSFKRLAGVTAAEPKGAVAWTGARAESAGRGHRFEQSPAAAEPPSGVR
jgi:hypothetical protein